MSSFFIFRKGILIMKNIYSEVVDKITKSMLLDKRLPWDSGLIDNKAILARPVSYVTGKNYRGINALILNYYGSGSMEYITFNQASKLSAKIKKGEKSLPILHFQLYNFTQKREAQDDDSKEDKIAPIVKKFSVFEISQTDSLTSKRNISTNSDIESSDEIDKKVEKYFSNTGIKFIHKIGCGSFIPSRSLVTVPDVSYYKAPNEYYSTLFHEIVHSTMLALEREDDRAEEYAYEELVAEIGAMFLCQQFSIAHSALERNSVSYIMGWADKLRENSKWLLSASSDAQKAVDFILEKMN